MKTILAITGTRADYGIQQPVYEALRQSKKFRLRLVVTGMHLDHRFGRTIDEIRADGFVIAATVKTLPEKDTKLAMAQYVGDTTTVLARVFSREKPDLVLLLGDRGEMLAAAFAAATLGIRIAHLHGGESSGTIDDVFRHAITQLADIHCTSADVHSRRVLQMKRDSARHIHTVGAPALDTILRMIPVSKDILLQHAGFSPALPTVVFVQHPDTLSPLPPIEQIGRSLKALQGFSGNLLLIGANADAGGRLFNATLRRVAASRPHTHFVMTLPHTEFLSWLHAADALVGNSSSGIIEAASFRLPVLNIGDRQRGRLRSGNVLDVPGDAKKIKHGLTAILHDRTLRAKLRKAKNKYGDGKASERIAKILAKALSQD